MQVKLIGNLASTTAKKAVSTVVAPYKTINIYLIISYTCLSKNIPSILPVALKLIYYLNKLLFKFIYFDVQTTSVENYTFTY